MPTRELREFSREVVEIMPLLVREFSKREDNDFTRGKISCPQMVVLVHLSHRPYVKMADIARLLSVTPGSASLLIDRLIRDKMLERRHDERDRRVVWIRSTAKGRKVVEQILEQKRQSVGAIFSVLNRVERRQYLSVLRKVRDRLALRAPEGCDSC